MEINLLNNRYDELIFDVMDERNEKMVLLILENEKFNMGTIKKDQYGNEYNLLGYAVSLGLEDVCNYLLECNRLESYYHMGSHPIQCLLKTFILDNRKNYPTKQEEIDKKYRLFHKLLENDNISLDIYTICSYINLYHTASEQTVCDFCFQCLKEMILSKKSDSIKELLSYLVYSEVSEELFQLALENKPFIQENFITKYGNNDFYQNIVSLCFQDCRYSGDYTISQDYLYDIVFHDEFTIENTILVIQYLLHLREKLVHCDRNLDKTDTLDVMNEIDNIMLQILSQKEFIKKEEGFYDKLAISFALYGNSNLYQYFMNLPNVEISDKSLYVIANYASYIREYTNIEEEDTSKPIYEYTKRKFSNQLTIYDSLTMDLLLWFSNFSSQVNDKKYKEILRKLNISKYFKEEDFSKIKTLLNQETIQSNMKGISKKVGGYEIECNDFFPEICYAFPNFWECPEYYLYRSCHQELDSCFTEDSSKNISIVIDIILSEFKLKEDIHLLLDYDANYNYFIKNQMLEEKRKLHTTDQRVDKPKEKILTWIKDKFLFNK